VNSNYFFIITLSACIACEKNQGNKGQPNSECQQDVTWSPTGVNWQSNPRIQYEKKKYETNNLEKGERRYITQS